MKLCSANYMKVLPITINYNKESAEKIIEKIEFAIEQHPSFLKVNPVKNLNKSL